MQTDERTETLRTARNAVNIINQADLAWSVVPHESRRPVRSNLVEGAGR